MRKLAIFFFIVLSMCLNSHSVSAALVAKSHLDARLETKQDKIDGSTELAGSVVMTTDVPGQVTYQKLGSSAYAEITQLATVVQGEKADTAIQPTGEQ